jgi:hypothetical protein
LPCQAHAQDEENYHGIRSLKAKGGKKEAKGGKKGGPGGNKVHGKNMGGKRMSCDNIPADMVNAFMSGMMIKSDATADMMKTMEDVSDGNFMVNGNMHSMDEMEPIDLLTADATIDVDGVELDPEEYPPPTVFCSNSNGMSMLVTTTLEGDLDTVFEINAEGTTTAQMQSISPVAWSPSLPE